jgi:hypothetical protein
VDLSAVERGARSLYCLEATMGREMAKDDRAERLKAALRENLKRRKAQARARDTAKEAPEEDRTTPSEVAVKRPAD